MAEGEGADPKARPCLVSTSVGQLGYSLASRSSANIASASPSRNEDTRRDLGFRVTLPEAINAFFTFWSNQHTGWPAPGHTRTATVAGWSRSWMGQAAAAVMGSRAWRRPIGCRMCSHKCSGFNGLQVRKTRRPQMAYRRLRGPCATHGTSDANLLSEPRTRPVRRCTPRPRREPAPGTRSRRPDHRPRACAPYAHGPVSLTGGSLLKHNPAKAKRGTRSLYQTAGE